MIDTFYIILWSIKQYQLWYVHVYQLCMRARVPLLVLVFICVRYFTISVYAFAYWHCRRHRYHLSSSVKMPTPAKMFNLLIYLFIYPFISFHIYYIFVLFVCLFSYFLKWWKVSDNMQGCCVAKSMSWCLLGMCSTRLLLVWCVCRQTKWVDPRINYRLVQIAETKMNGCKQYGNWGMVCTHAIRSMAGTPFQRHVTTEFGAEISNRTYCMWDVITRQYPDFNGILIKPPKLEYDCVSTSTVEYRRYNYLSM